MLQEFDEWVHSQLGFKKKEKEIVIFLGLPFTSNIHMLEQI
jgi:hypothetical protein